jgi:hypothetical protein
MEITKDNVVKAIAEYNSAYGTNIEPTDDLINKIIELDSKGTSCFNIDDCGQSYHCHLMWGGSVSHDGFCHWAYGESYAKYSSVEIICRGGWMDSSTDGERYDVDGDLVE